MTLPPRLYKFRALTAGTVAYVARILTHNELYFPAAAQLNDPWESRPRLRVSADRWTVVDGADGNMREVPPELVSHDPLPLHARASPSHGHEIDSESLEYIHSRVGQPYSPGTLFRDHPRFRLCSFAATQDHPLLWSHYADAHRGLCIGFATSVEPFAGALRIEYQSEYPVLPGITERFNYRDAERAALLHKSDVWGYEDEYRLLTGVHGTDEPSFLDHRNVLCFPPDAIVSVTLGCAMSEADQTLVRSWLSARPQPVGVFQARVDDHRYELVFDPVTWSGTVDPPGSPVK